MSTPSKSAKKNVFEKREKKPIEDPRFKQIESDARFRRFRDEKSKLKVDSRFKSMFTDKKFQVSSGKYDPRGKRIDKSQREQYEKFYELEDEEEDQENPENQENKEEEPEEEIQARQEEQDSKPRRRGPNFNQAIYEGFSSSSDDESDLSNDQEEIEESEFNEKGNEDDQVEMGDATKRIAVMNCDWWKMKAVDLFVVFSSFLPTGGSIKSVTIYPSDYGEQELAKETETGPKVFEDIDQEGERTEDGKFIDPEKEAMRLTKIRQYEVNRFKYFYAVVELDSVKTASLIYEQCDGLEVERTSNVLDIRYIPDDVTFTKKPKEVATSAPFDYKAPTFFTAALQSSNVEITWDQTDYNRLQLTTKKFNKDEMREDDFRAYLASDSEESDDDLPPLEGGEEDDENREKIRNKYQSLIEAITPKYQESEEMEITFTPGFTETAETLLDEKKERDLEKDETVWETQQRKMREKKKEKKAARKEEFKRQEEEQKAELEKLKKQQRNKRRGKETEEEKKSKAELELLMMDDNGKQHKKGYNLQSLIEDDEEGGKKSKKKRKMEKKQEDEFKVDVQDERFQQLFSNPQDFGIDPTHKNYKKTAGMKQIMKERVTRRQETDTKQEEAPNSEISNLIKSVKKKAQMHPVVKKQKF